MLIDIKLVGFGEDRPARFNDKNSLQVDVETPVSVRELLRLVQIEEAPDLIIMDSERVFPSYQWDEPAICEQAALTILSAIEGG